MRNPGERPAEDPKASAPYRVRLPGFITDREVGLGDAIQRVTSYVGIKPCGGCNERTAALNRQFVFSRWRGR